MKANERLNGVEFISLMGDDKTKAIHSIIDMLTELSNNNKLSLDATARPIDMFVDSEHTMGLNVKANKSIVNIVFHDYVGNRIFSFAVRHGENNSTALIECIQNCKNAMSLNEFKRTINGVLESNK